MYKDFEDKFRGSKDEVKEKLKKYLPLIENKEVLIDLGCGRGEWIELTGAIGVDIENYTNKKIIISDAIDYLKKVDSESVDVITSFHMIEHIEFEKLIELIKEAKRVLKNNGYLILETPNPQNLRVATELFYLDPTHKRVIPKDLLKFILEYEGFFTKVFLINAKREGNFRDIFYGVGFDYVAIASKEEFDFALNEAMSIDEAIEEEIKRRELEIRALRNELNSFKKEYYELKNLVDNIHDAVIHLSNFHNKIMNSIPVKILKKVKRVFKKKDRVEEIYEMLRRENDLN